MISGLMSLSTSFSWCSSKWLIHCHHDISSWHDHDDKMHIQKPLLKMFWLSFLSFLLFHEIDKYIELFGMQRFQNIRNILFYQNIWRKSAFVIYKYIQSTQAMYDMNYVFQFEGLGVRTLKFVACRLSLDEVIRLSRQREVLLAVFLYNHYVDCRYQWWCMQGTVHATPFCTYPMVGNKRTWWAPESYTFHFPETIL